MRFLLLSILSLAFLSCASTKLAERKAVPPPGSGEGGDQPWNIPQQGEGAGALGGLLEGR